MAMMAHVGFAPVGDADDDHPGPDARARAETARLRAQSFRTMPASLPAFQGAPVDVMARAHRRAVDAIRSGPGDTKVGWTVALVDYQAADDGEERTALAREKGQLEWLDVCADDDFVGVQTYSRERIGPEGMVARPTGAARMLTGWEVYPAALGHTVRMAAERACVPVIVTENGCATADDAERIAYTEEALRGLAACIADGVDVLGYLHWSLLDNFEWASGFAITFGLIAVDRTTFERTAKPSLAWLGETAISARNS
jgi:beta-glucosidase